MLQKKISSIVLGLSLSLLSSLSVADMTLDNTSSSVNFVSIKAEAIGEVFDIKQLSGTLSDKGELQVSLNLSNVDTIIPIRNERMNQFLFETDKYPSVTLKAQIDPDSLSTQDVNTIKTEATLSLHGISKTIPVEATIVRSENKLMAVSTKPIIIAAADYNLTSGIDKLLELAKLPSIAKSVPVNFILVFSKDESVAVPSK